MTNLQDFINQYNGRHNIGDTVENRDQCVGLVEVWTDNLGEPHTWGNADDLLADADTGAFDVIYNTPTNYPLPGDVICWGAGWAGSAVGHTAVVVSADVNTFTAFEQNDRIDGGDGACRVHSFPDYAGVQGWLHPHALDTVPAPAPGPIVAPPVDPAPAIPPADPPAVDPAPETTTPVDPAPIRTDPQPTPDQTLVPDSAPTVDTPLHPPVLTITILQEFFRQIKQILLDILAKFKHKK